MSWRSGRYVNSVKSHMITLANLLTEKEQRPSGTVMSHSSDEVKDYRAVV